MPHDLATTDFVLLDGDGSLHGWEHLQVTGPPASKG
jgi:hypothetical protein